MRNLLFKMTSEPLYHPTRIPNIRMPIPVNPKGGTGMEMLSPYDAGLGAIVYDSQKEKLNKPKDRK